MNKPSELPPSDSGGEQSQQQSDLGQWERQIHEEPTVEKLLVVLREVLSEEDIEVVANAAEIGKDSEDLGVGSALGWAYTQLATQADMSIDEIDQFFKNHDILE